MNKADFAMLEKAFEAEINAALGTGYPVIQSKSKVAKRLAEQGLIQEHTITLGGKYPVTVTGYVLTHAGRIAFGSQLTDEDLILK